MTANGSSWYMKIMKVYCKNMDASLVVMPFHRNLAIRQPGELENACCERRRYMKPTFALQIADLSRLFFTSIEVIYS